MTGPPIITCPDCVGLACRVEICGCREGGGVYLIAADRPGPIGSAWSDCVRCDGDGTYVVPCESCRRQGRRRAHLVATVANVDTGAVASADFRPGGGAHAHPQPDGHGGWHLDLTPMLRRLADRVGVTVMHRLGSPDRPVTGLTLPIERTWRPELPADQRYAREAAAVARHARASWLVYLGPLPPTGPLQTSPLQTGRPTLAELGRLALGLGLSVRITVCDHRDDPGRPTSHRSVSWSVEAVGRGPSSAGTAPLAPLYPTLAAAVRCAWETLEIAIIEAVPADPAGPIVVPQASPVDTDTAARHWSAVARRARELAYGNPGRTVLAVLDHDGERATVQRATTSPRRRSPGVRALLDGEPTG
ncbi:hypothetical protein [Micromonospora sp. NBC_01813]|uniref:hypothetical protein n=1 Tax=Micromonospora sp. NBC_01813 TaxID=2975988 RepID=UPI002DDAE7BC|nr:hypothetical protein [Micromonospora sp. NBC_01813]WSA09414.1 hypothetical protein OG958_00845 [Micromonospora sp. NBC_01813]